MRTLGDCFTGAGGAVERSPGVGDFARVAGVPEIVPDDNDKSASAFDDGVTARDEAARPGVVDRSEGFAED